jgi:flagellar biosynthesis/type III secretory pathway protein FliH
MSAADAFIPLADLLRPLARVDAAAPPAPAEPEAEPVAAPPVAEVGAAPEMVQAIRDARLFRARLTDALDARLARVLAAIASEIVVRELRTAPADLAALVARIAAEHASAPLCIRVAPADRAALPDGDVAVIEDATLDAGDAIVALDAGDVDARIGVRLAAVLEALR